jgi:hypothetical protein
LSDESLYREVDEEIRQDEYKKLWNRYGNLLIAGCVGFIALVAGYKGYQAYEVRQSQTASMAYFEGARLAAEGKTDDALRALDTVKHAGYAQLARMQAAGVLAAAGKSKEAVAAYDAITADGAVDQSFRDAAAIRAGYLLVDTAKPDELLPRLGKFDAEGNPWRTQAREIFGLTAYRVQDFTMADRYMQAIFADPAAPQDMKSRAQIMIQMIQPHLNK